LWEGPVKRNQKRLAGAITLVSLALAVPIALVGTGAIADVIDTEASIRYRDATGVFKGVVESELQECEGDRTVILFKVRPGDDKRVGSDTTSARGRWRIEKDNADGTYYVKVRRLTLGGYNGADDRCARDRSERIRV
jgi:hypothetical protein